MYSILISCVKGGNNLLRHLRDYFPCTAVELFSYLTLRSWAWYSYCSKCVLSWSWYTLHFFADLLSHSAQLRVVNIVMHSRTVAILVIADCIIVEANQSGFFVCHQRHPFDWQKLGMGFSWPRHHWWGVDGWERSREDCIVCKWAWVYTGVVCWVRGLCLGSIRGWFGAGFPHFSCQGSLSSWWVRTVWSASESPSLAGAGGGRLPALITSPVATHQGCDPLLFLKSCILSACVDSF